MLDQDKQAIDQSAIDIMADGPRQAFLDKQFGNLRITSIFLFPLVAFLAFRAQEIIPFFFKESFAFAVSPFQIIVWSIIFIYFNYLFLKIALFLKRMQIVLSSFCILALYAAVLNFCLIPRYWLIGISISTIISVAVMFVFIVFYLTQAGIRIPLYKSLEKPAIATMGMTVVLHYIDSWPFILILISGFVVYSLILIITMALDK